MTHESARRLLLAAVLCASLSVPALGQLQLLGHSPAHGTANVPILTTLSMTFNAPLDPTVQFPASDGFFLVAEMFPDAGGPLDLRLTGDGSVLEADFLLAPDTQYWLVLHDARAVGGAALDRVYYFTFTTAPTIPTGSISGRVTMDSTPLAGANVQAIATDSLFADYDTQIGGYAVTDPSGNYVIDYVPDGQYVVIAMTDDDRDTEPAVGEGLGGRDADGDRLLDTVEVQDGLGLEGVDISAETLQGSSAGDFVTGAGEAASTILAGEEVALTGAIGVKTVPEGTSEAWLYVFHGVTTGTPTLIFQIGGWYVPGGPPLMGIDLTVPVLPGWVDSNVAVGVAEAAGGAEFRATYPEAQIMAILAGTTDIFGGGAGKRAPENAFFGQALPWRAYGTPESRPKADPEDESIPRWLAPARSLSIAADGPTWFIGYDSDSDSRMFLIDAMTGELIGSPGMSSPARDSYAAAQDAAVAWKSDAALVMAAAAGSEGIDAGGLSPYWSFGFYSPSGDTAYMVATTAGLVVAESEIDPGDLLSTAPLPEGWIDSDAAAAVAEANSGGFRSSYDPVYVQAFLSKNVVPGYPDHAAWFFNYVSLSTPNMLVVFVDALTGAVVTSTESPDVPGLDLALDSPYPNPAADHAFTAVRGRVSSPARLVVEDLLGRRIADLGEIGPASSDRTVRIDTGSWPSGVYFVRLVGSGQVTARKLVVVR